MSTNSSLQTGSFSGSTSNSSPRPNLKEETTVQLESSIISTPEPIELLSSESKNSRLPTKSLVKPTSSLNTSEASQAATNTSFLTEAGSREVKEMPRFI